MRTDCDPTNKIIPLICNRNPTFFSQVYLWFFNGTPADLCMCFIPTSSEYERIRVKNRRIKKRTSHIKHVIGLMGAAEAGNKEFVTDCIEIEREHAGDRCFTYRYISQRHEEE